MHKRDAQQRIILALGREGKPLNPHVIAERTGLSDAGVQSAIKGTQGLVSVGMLRPFKEESWRAGGKKVDYLLTFRGVIEYLNLIETGARTEIITNENGGWKIVGRPDAYMNVKEFIQKYSGGEIKFCDYVPFKEHGALREWLGDSAYGFFYTAARKVKSRHLPYIVTARRQYYLEAEMSVALDELNETESELNEVLGKKEETPPAEQIAAIESERDKIKCWIRAMREDAEKLWKHAFSLMLFELIYRDVKGKIKRIVNESLHKHIKETFETERRECAARVDNIREMKATFEKVFSTNLKIKRKGAPQVRY